MQYRVEFDAYSEATGGDVRYFVADPGATTTHLDSPATTWFQPRLGRKPVLEQHLHGRASLFGRSQGGGGIVGLINLDGWWDTRIAAVDNRRIAIYRSATGAGVYPRDWDLVLIGTMQNFEVRKGEVLLAIRDRWATVAERQAGGEPFDGSNSLPDGVEGEPTDLEGKYKPAVWGPVRNVPLPMVNRSKLTYQAAEAWGSQTINIGAMYTQGATITPGTSRASLAVLQAATVTGATWDDYDSGVGGAAGPVSDGAYARLGSASKAVTADITEGASAADRTTAQTIRRVLTGPGLQTDNDLDLETFRHLDSMAGGEVGIWVGTNGRTVGEVVDDLAASTGSWCLPGRDGKFRVGRIEAPSGVPLAVITGTQILAVDDPVRVIPSSDTKRGLPPKRVILRYGRNYQVMNSADITGAVDEDTEQARWLANEYRQVIEDGLDRLVRHPLADDMIVTTLLANRADAVIEARRRLLLLAPGTSFYECDLHMSEAPVVTVNGVRRCLQPADTVQLQYRRFGLSNGRLVLITGLREDHGEQRITLTMWG